MFKTFKYLIGVPLLVLIAVILMLLVIEGIFGGVVDVKATLQTWADISKVYIGSMTALHFYEFYKAEAD